jgi:hypothetical protein
MCHVIVFNEVNVTRIDWPGKFLSVLDARLSCLK